jgi:RimJ/RimL family protein N-acetyltransferase
MARSSNEDFRQAPIEFRRLPQVAIPDLVALFNLPEVRRHLPLARDPFTPEMCERFVAAKERLWAEHGYGPWAFFVENAFAGWGGLQPEGGDADFGLVLHPHYWGLGPVLCREVLRHAFREMGLESVIVLLPPSRTRIRALLRLGLRLDGEMQVGGERFLRYRLLNPGAAAPRS